MKYDHSSDITCGPSDNLKVRDALIQLYREDIAETANTNIPIILNAATYRASRNHLFYNKVFKYEHLQRTNISMLDIIITLQNQLQHQTPIILGAPLGSMFDAYCTQKIPSEEESYLYHQEQISIFKTRPIDFINAVTLSSLSEALGVASACDKSDLEYTIGFILNNNGTLLDGTCLFDAIKTIDNHVNNIPLGYLITCTHVSVISLIDNTSENADRIIGIQANGSNLPLSELPMLNRSVADDPQKFSSQLKTVKDRFNLKIIAGCCGTTKDHLRHIIRACLPSTQLKKEN